MDELNKYSLKKLRLLIEIGIHKGKKSPIVIGTEKY